MLQKMMRRFDASDKNTKELRSELASIGKKVDAHAISIKHLEFQMTQLFTFVNPCQPGTLLINTIQNPKSDRQCMTVTTRWGKETIDPPMSFVVEDDVRKHNEVVEASGELVDKVVNEEEIPKTVIPFPRPPPPFLQ